MRSHSLAKTGRVSRDGLEHGLRAPIGALIACLSNLCLGLLLA